MMIGVSHELTHVYFSHMAGPAVINEGQDVTEHVCDVHLAHVVQHQHGGLTARYRGAGGQQATCNHTSRYL
jgi:hypothetical protein